MKIEQIYTGCLSQGAYYIESNGEAVIIDPLREVKPYIQRAKEDGAKIKYIFETHFHADFVSGHLTLAKETGATIVYGPTATPAFDALIAKDEQVFKLGDVSIIVLHTPGHTMESTTFLLRDEKGKDKAIFTGDTLFLGDVGRPDLAQKSTNLTKENLAELLYDSLRNKIMPLADDVIVYPAHGAGSACGKNMSNETIDTLGNQKRTNYALRANMSKEEFVKEVTDGLLPPPAYFPQNVTINKQGYEDIDIVMHRSKHGLKPHTFERIAKETNALILDVRHQNEFRKGHIPGSISIGLGGTFAPWVGTIVKDTQRTILLVTPQGEEEETIIRLGRVGFDNASGYLEGGIASWEKAGKEIDIVKAITANEFADKINSTKSQPVVFDVRAPQEYDTGHFLGSHNTPLTYLYQYFEKFPKKKTFYIHCQSGYRSAIASSILKGKGYHNFFDISDGFQGMAKAKI